MFTKLRRWWPSPVRDLIVNGAAGSALVPEVVRVVVLNWYGAKIDRTAQIQHHVHFEGSEVTVGARTYINHHAFIDSNVTIGQWVQIGNHAKLIAGSHHIEGSGHRGGATFSEPVIVGDGAWIGAGVIVLPGVTIGPGCVIGAGAVVTKDCEPDGLYVGVPAQRIKELSS